MLVIVLVWIALVSGFTAESLTDSKEDLHHRIWEREIKKSAERARTIKDFADSSNKLLDDVKLYYRIMLDSSSASEEAENNPVIDFDDDRPRPVQPAYYSQPGSANNRYWVAPPFNQKPLHTAPTRNEEGLQVKIPARYMVMFQGRATMDHLTRTVTVMEEVTRASNRKIRATDFKIYEHAANGFTATLNNAALDAVSNANLYRITLC